MEALVQEFVDFLEKDKRLSMNTLQSYRRDIEQYFSYLQEINLQNIANTNKTTVIAYLLYLQKKGRATSTISRNLASIRSFYQYIAKNKLIDHDPTAELESPKVEEEAAPDIVSGGSGTASGTAAVCGPRRATGIRRCLSCYMLPVSECLN